jgi:hypothetical protein
MVWVEEMNNGFQLEDFY